MTSGVSTLVNLDLTLNRDLGGCAEMWARHLKGMRHLEEVNLAYCALIDKDVEPIAVALSDIQTLVHLNLMGNTALGGCASLWALHLKRMNHLKELLLGGCNLTDVDMKPIAESVSDMPNLSHLDLTCNDALGSCAPLWALHLKRMNHLKKLTLVMCNLVDDDMEHIAESVSDMPNLSHLDLTCNTALGGCASLWALHLKRMNHLKKLTLVLCNLVDDDMEPIAESVSDMPNLIHLDLTCNDALGGCASLWALHLKRMNHLKNLILARCFLTDVDMEPIAESVSDMPNLSHLDLTRNRALGGCASLWALHLKRMNHLKELTLVLCNLTDVDMKPIAESVSDMPNLIHLDLTWNGALGGCASSWAQHLKLMTKHLKKLTLCGLTYEDQEYINASSDLNLTILDFTP
ncbi:leucine-rich repeat-containing protein 31-like [Asterias rubens]|uniref:leucine-rich repeat-containing protein 31-like n=1 Tax=Asterias rubens TaxID=7604 RepID=UPI001455544B|nr:leucine-rich repeat-containing protein 31-like [Asterias rubens]